MTSEYPPQLRQYLEKYRVEPEPKRRFPTYLSKRIDTANSVPIAWVLRDEYGLDVPEGVTGSMKINCPFGWEHPDGGVEKTARIYSTNNVYCFADFTHGRMTPVSLIQAKYSYGLKRSLSFLERKYDLETSEPYWERMRRLVLEREQASTSHGDPALAVAALQESLRRLTSYTRRQYDQDVLDVFNKHLRALEDALASSTQGAVQEWFRAAREEIGKVVEDQ